MRSYSQLASADPGFDPRRMVTLVLNVTGRTDVRNMRPNEDRTAVVYDGSGLLGVAQFYQELIAAHRCVAGRRCCRRDVRRAAEPGAVPRDSRRISRGRQQHSPATITSRTSAKSRPNTSRRSAFARSRGRLLEPTDRRGGAGVVVINEAYARAYLDGENPIGRRIALPEAARPGGLAFVQLGEQTLVDAEIVGVIPDIKQATLEDAVQPALFVPQQQWTMRKMAVVIRAENDDSCALIPAIRRELADMDSTLPGVFAVYSDVVAAGLARHRLGALVLVVFGFVSLTLAAVGTYGLMSFSVNQRVQRDRGTIRVRRERGRASSRCSYGARCSSRASVSHRRRRRDRDAPGRCEPTLRDQRARSVGARARAGDDARSHVAGFVRARAPSVANRRVGRVARELTPLVIAIIPLVPNSLPR